MKPGPAANSAAVLHTSCTPKGGRSREVAISPGLRTVLAGHRHLRGGRVIGLDISPREKLGVVGEQGDLHDYAGGSWPWLQAELAKWQHLPKASVLIASHIPMQLTPGGLDADQMAKVKALLDAHPGLVHGHIAGHYHVDLELRTPAMSHVSYVVGSTFAGNLPVHIATATVAPGGVTWQHETIDVPGWQ